MKVLSCLHDGLHNSWKLILLASCFIAVLQASTVVVDSPFGKIKGARNTHGDAGESYVSFKGIPYAKPPLGDLRFAKPQPHPPLDDVFDGSQYNKKICPHPDLMRYGETEFTEDCLVLNIYAKVIDPSSTSLKKVLVFIHGGGFIMGTGYFYEPKSFVISQDIIVVTINYRLGVLGFLSTENEASPGNYGLWDQTLALKWVRSNIRAFGGDPYDVTISGESAGGASVGYQMITPHAKGLFTKAYPQSGTATSIFALTVNAQSHALNVAKSAGCWDKDIDVNNNLSVEESNAVVACLRKVPVSSLTSFSGFVFSKTQFVPVVDNDFVPDLPAKLLENEGYLDFIGFFDRSYFIAIVNSEIAIPDFFIQMTKAAIFMNNETSNEEKESIWNQMLKDSKDLCMTSRLGEEGASIENTVSKIDDFYNRRFVNSSVMSELVTDLSFLIPSLDYLSAASRRKSCSAYFLYFDYYPHYMKGQYRGSPHALDLAYWFDVDLQLLEKVLNVGIDGEMTDEDLELKRQFSSIVGEFVRSGNPGKHLKDKLPSGWPKYDVTNSYYLNFNCNPWVSSFLEKDKQDLWFKTVPKPVKKEHRHSEL